MISEKKMAIAADTALGQCLGLKTGEKLLVLANPEMRRIGEVLYKRGLKLGGDAALLVYPKGTLNGEEPPPLVAHAMVNADVVIAATVTSITHTTARKKACQAGTRIATMPGITEEIFVRGLGADYDEVAALCNLVFKWLDTSRVAHVTSPSGTDLVLDIRNRACVSDGNLRAKGAGGNLPTGESELAPKTANGILVVDRCGNVITEPTRLEIKDGHIVSYDNNPSGKRFKKLIDQAKKIDGNDNASFVAEFAIGTNKSARVSGVILEDEKVYGTCHVAFGNNTSYPGGKNHSTLHIDVIVFKPTIMLDGRTIMKKGKLVSEE
jgi:aminopeptidase